MCSSFSCFAYFVVLYFVCFLKKPILNFSCFNVIKDFPGGSAGKESAGNVGDVGSIPGSGKSPGRRNGNPLQYSCLDRGAWWAIMIKLAIYNNLFFIVVIHIM